MTNPIPAPIPPSPRRATNRANSQHSTGPRTAAGKQRSSLNALRHGLTAASPVLPSEDRAAYNDHRRGFFDEYQPATPTESQLVEELAATSWRLNRIPLLEAEVLARAAAPVPPDRGNHLRYRRRPSPRRQPRHPGPAPFPAVPQGASTSSARSRPTAPPARAPRSQRCRRPPRTPQTQGNPLGARRSWLRFFEMTRSNASPIASGSSTRRATSNTCFSTCRRTRNRPSQVATAPRRRTFLLRPPRRLRHSRNERPCRAQPNRTAPTENFARSTGQFYGLRRFSMADDFLFLTELLGLKVYDLKGRRLGLVKDAALVPLIHPARVDRFLIGGGWAWLTIRHDQIRSISLDGIYLKDEAAHPLPFRRIHAAAGARSSGPADHRWPGPQSGARNRRHVQDPARIRTAM